VDANPGISGQLRRPPAMNRGATSAKPWKEAPARRDYGVEDGPVTAVGMLVTA
jgi:hypothetical protein